MEVITHILFDNDGILVDTEQYYYKSSRDVLKTIGLNLTKELFSEYSLKRGVGVWEAFHDKLSSSDIDKLRKIRDKEYNTLIKTENIEILGAKEVLQELSSRFEIAIITSALKNDFLTIHNRTGFLEYATFYLTNGDYSESKPSPAPYLLALEKFSTNPINAIVIEDTIRGIIAGNRAGIKTVAIPNEINNRENFSMADYRLNSINELPELIDRINSGIL